MSDTALSKDAMLLSLRDIRLPSEAAGGMIADIAVVVGIASLAALVCVAVLRLLSQRPRPVQSVTPKDQLAALQGLSEPDKRVALLHLLRAHAPERFDALRGDLYRRDAPLEVSQLEAEVARVV